MLSSTDNGGGLNSISFSAVWENLQADAELNEEIKNQFEAMIKAANNYTYYRQIYIKTKSCSNLQDVIEQQFDICLISLNFYQIHNLKQ